MSPVNKKSPNHEVLVIDAGVGNLGNLERALRKVGGQPRITDRPQEVAKAGCLVLPGVGAFRPPRERLRGDLEQALKDALAAGAWLLGICVGYQLLFDGSSEFGDTDGLGLLPGRVDRLPDHVTLPQIGWNRLTDERQHPLLDGLASGSYFYFVHTYAPCDTPDDICLARAVHGSPFVAIAGKDRVLGTQFHPEKSGENGLRLLANYLALSGGASC